MAWNSAIGGAARTRRGRARLAALTGVLALACLAACQPRPPISEVRDPFAAPLPGASPVQTAPLSAPGLGVPGEVEASPITPAQPLGQGGTGAGGPDPFDVGSTVVPSAPRPAETGSAGDTGFTVRGAAEAIEEAGGGDSDTVTQIGAGGLVERLPDTCRLDDYRQWVGQQAFAATSVITERPTRVIAPGDIVSQEYDPRRVNFYTGNNGVVERITCG